MNIGERLRKLRKQKQLSQAELQKRSGIFGSYISRLEHEHIKPSIYTLQKLAYALDTPIYQFFAGADVKKGRKVVRDWINSRKEAVLLEGLRVACGSMREKDRKLLLSLARCMAASKNKAKLAECSARRKLVRSSSVTDSEHQNLH